MQKDRVINFNFNGSSEDLIGLLSAHLTDNHIRTYGKKLNLDKIGQGQNNGFSRISSAWMVQSERISTNPEEIRYVPVKKAIVLGYKDSPGISRIRPLSLEFVYDISRSNLTAHFM